MDLSNLLNGFVIVVPYISCTLPNKTKISKFVEWVKILSAFWVCCAFDYVLNIVHSKLLFHISNPSLSFHSFFLMGLDMIYLRWHSRRVNQRKYFKINCSLETLISSYFHRFNSMAVVCNSIVYALFWILQRKNDIV